MQILMHRCSALISYRYFRLALLIAASLWLILKSPVYFYLFQDRLSRTGFSINPLEIYYYWIEFSVWALCFIPVFIYIFSSLDFKAFISKYRLTVLVVFNFFYALFRTFKTLDVTDTGFHFTKAWGLFHGSVSQNIDFLVGTSFFNGLWLSLAGAPNVLWARFGYVLVVTGITFISFKIYSLYFKRLAAWLIFAILSVFFIHYNYYLSINYDNLPVLFALAGVWLLLGNKNSMASYIFSGIFLSLTFWLKFNFILIFTLPFIYAWVLFEDKQAWVRPFLYICAGYVICIASGIVLLYSSGNLPAYINYLDEHLIHRPAATPAFGKDFASLSTQSLTFEESAPKKSSDPFFFLDPGQKGASERKHPLYLNPDRDSHALKKLFKRYCYGAWSALQKSAVLSVVILILLFMLGDCISVKKTIVHIIFALGIHYAVFLRFEGAFFIYMTVLILPGYFFCIYSLRYDRNFVLPTVLILLIALFSFPGSDLSFNVIYRSGAGLLFFAFPLAFMLDKKIHFNRQILNVNHYVIIVVLMIMFSIAHPWAYNASHRDLRDRSLLVTMFRAPQLFGVHTFPQRVKVVDDALEFFSKETYEKDNTPALFLSWIPMMYYLTQTNCMMNNPWHGCVSFKIFKKEFEKVTETKQPVYITFSKIRTRNTSWPLFDKKYRKQDKAWIIDLKKSDFIRYWMKDKNYSKVFENDMFEIYKQG